MTVLPQTGYAACLLGDGGAFWCCWEDGGSPAEEPLACGFAPTTERAIRAARRLADTAPEGSRQVAAEHAERVLGGIEKDRKLEFRLAPEVDPAEYCRRIPYEDIVRIAVRSYRPSWGDQGEYEAAERTIAAILAGEGNAVPLKFCGRGV